jgi:hypothetical protein
MTNDQQTLGELQSSVRLSLATLTQGLGRTKHEIAAHCAKIRSDVDSQAETLINKINEDRTRLFDEISAYESEAFATFNASEEKRCLERLALEVTTFANGFDDSPTTTTPSTTATATATITSREEQLALTSRYLSQLQAAVSDLARVQFGNNMIDFESICFPSDHFLGGLFYKPVRNDGIIEERGEISLKINYRQAGLIRGGTGAVYVPFVDYADPVRVHLKPLNSGKFLLFENLKNGDKRLSVLSADFRFVERSRLFVQCFAHEPIENKLQDQRLILSGDLLCFYVRMESSSKDVEYHVYIIDESLNLLRTKNFKV